MIVTSQLFEAYTNPDYHEKLSILDEYDAELFIKSDSNFRRTIAHFRDTGMLIYTRGRRIIQHYAAVFIVRGENLSALLRETEPPNHDKWDHRLITGTTRKRREQRNAARACIKKIEDSILERLRTQFEVTAEDTIDAAGVGNYLPDLEDGFSGQAEGTDALRPKIQISSVRPKTRPKDTTRIHGKVDEGSEKQGSTGGTRKTNGRKSPPLPPVDRSGKKEALVPTMATRK